MQGPVSKLVGTWCQKKTIIGPRFSKRVPPPGQNANKRSSCVCSLSSRNKQRLAQKMSLEPSVQEYGHHACRLQVRRHVHIIQGNISTAEILTRFLEAGMSQRWLHKVQADPIGPEVPHAGEIDVAHRWRLPEAEYPSTSITREQRQQAVMRALP